MYRIIWMAAALAAIGAGQTQVDLRTQSKSVDFSAASSTKPVTTGTALPSTCSVGQMFFLSNAPAGQNVYGCAAVNTWTLQSGSGGGSGSGVGVESAGTLVGTRATFNFPSGGTCMATAVADTGTVINITPSVNTALCPSDAILQGGSAPNICTSASGSGTAYTAACATTLTALSAKQVLWWHIDHVSASIAPTLNVDGLGAQTITDGLGNALGAATTLAAGMEVPVWNDGTHFRVMTLPAGGISPSPVTTPFWPFGPGVSLSSNTSASGSANVTQFFEILVPYPGLTLTNISAYTFTTAPGHVAWAIYDSTCTLVTNGTSSTVSASPSTATNWVFSPAVILVNDGVSGHGTYFLASTSDAATTEFYAPPFVNAPGLGALNTGAGSLHYFTGTASTGTSTLAFPSTCGTRTSLASSNSLPGVVLH